MTRYRLARRPEVPGDRYIGAAARVAKLVDARDLKSLGHWPCRFESCPGHAKHRDNFR